MYFTADFIGPSYIGEIVAGSPRTLLRFAGPPTGLALDRPGNILTQQSSTVDVYAHHTGKLLRTINVAGFQSLSLSDNDSALYSGAGTIDKYAYPAGTLLDSITSLANDNTFGITTFPAPPYAQPW